MVSAEGRAVAAIQKRGYADVKAQPREVIVDHADRTVTPDYKISAGQIARLDGIQLTTNGRTSLPWLQNLAPWKRGAAYDPDNVAELERRLLDTGVYESVTVALSPADQLTPDGLRPVVVSVAERKKRTIELGASYDTTDGLGPGRQVDALQRAGPRGHLLGPWAGLQHRQPDRGGPLPAALADAAADARPAHRDLSRQHAGL